MGQLLSVESLEGEAAIGKSTFITREMERAARRRDRDQYGYIFTDPGTSPDIFQFLKGEDEDDFEDGRGLCPLDCSQAGIAHGFWFDLLRFARNPDNREKTRILTDRSPLSHLVYEFWWRRLFPLTKRLIGNNNGVMADGHVGYGILQRLIVESERGRDCLLFFRRAIVSFLRQLERCARKEGFEYIIYLAFSDFGNEHLHANADERRNRRGGFDRFPAEPLEGDRVEFCELLYGAGECLLWNQVWRAYRRDYRPRSTSLQMYRLRCDVDGLLFDEEAAGGSSILMGLDTDRFLQAEMEEEVEIEVEERGAVGGRVDDPVGDPTVSSTTSD